MRKVVFVEPQTEEWKRWRKKVKNSIARQKYVLGQVVKIDEKLYKQCKDDIVRLFHGKCAYCEQKILNVAPDGRVGQLNQPGDIEHFRPKGRVTDINGALVYCKSSPNHLHPGYYWLAYDPLNLLLACETCNRPLLNAVNTAS